MRRPSLSPNGNSRAVIGLLKEMANPLPPAQSAFAAQNSPPLAQPAPQAANPVAPEVPPAMNQVGEPVYKWFRRQKLPQFDRTHDPAMAKDWFQSVKPGLFIACNIYRKS